MSEQPYHLGRYSLQGLALAEAALFQAWGGLEKFHEDLVVVGGLAVYHHTRNTENQVCYGEVASDSKDFRLRTNLVSIAKELLNFK